MNDEEMIVNCSDASMKRHIEIDKQGKAVVLHFVKRYIYRSNEKSERRREIREIRLRRIDE